MQTNIILHGSLDILGLYMVALCYQQWKKISYLFLLMTLRAIIKTILISKGGSSILHTFHKIDIFFCVKPDNLIP